MDKDKLSDREAALIAAARREAEARKGTAAPPRAAAAPQPAPAPQQTKAIPPAAIRPAVASPVAEKPKPSAAERMAQLMAEERAENEERKRKIRRYGITIPSVIIAIAALWVLFVLRRR
jgi:hypothetical protein